jgi:hypothetical protein
MSVLHNSDAPYEEAKAAARELLPYSHPSVESRTGGATHEEGLGALRKLGED